MNVSQSSHLQNYSYDEESQILTVGFQNGTIYAYRGVPQYVHQELQQNGGGGTYFWAKIRNSYPVTKVFDPRE